MDDDNLIANDMVLVRSASKESYSTVAVFKDLYGNLWALIEFIPAP
jgi:hypothetical protein